MLNVMRVEVGRWMTLTLEDSKYSHLQYGILFGDKIP
jgi:hypothetical protein